MQPNARGAYRGAANTAAKATREDKLNKKIQRARACNEEKEYTYEELETCSLYNTEARGMIDEWLANFEDQLAEHQEGAKSTDAK